MNPRHAAALALMGWYLMYPPDYMRAGDISAWGVIGSAHDTARECRAARRKLIKDQQKRDADPNGTWGNQDWAIQGLEMSKCIKDGRDTKMWDRDLAKDGRATPGQPMHPYSGPK
jgi:hypothetical protein